MHNRGPFLVPSAVNTGALWQQTRGKKHEIPDTFATSKNLASEALAFTTAARDFIINKSIGTRVDYYRLEDSVPPEFIA